MHTRTVMKTDPMEAISSPTTGMRPISSRLPFGLRGLLVVALAIVAAVMAMSWGWWAAIGAAPLILAFAPCAVMCALGLCMHGGGGK